MKLRELEGALGEVRPFGKPKVALEQYPTGAHLAACMLHTMADAFDELEGCVVADLGCGTGVLSIGAALAGAERVVGVDVDPDALAICKENIDDFELEGEIDLLHAAIGAGVPLPMCARAPAALHVRCAQTTRRAPPSRRCSADPLAAPCPHDSRPGSVDVVVMNPPFGTKTKGADAAFMAAARALEPRAVWSLHKSSTRGFLEKHALKTLGFSSAEVVAEMRYDLPKTYKFHKKASLDIEVDLWRFGLERDED